MRSLAAALLAAVGVLSVGAAHALAAFQVVTLSAAAGPVGTPIAMHVEISGLLGSSPSVLWLIGEEAFEGSPESSHCEDRPGAIAVGELTWEAAFVEFQGAEYRGFVGDTSFTVPRVPPGAYVLAQTIDAQGTGCHSFTSFEVTTGALPDTAMTSDGALPVSAADLVVGVGDPAHERVVHLLERVHSKVMDEEVLLVRRTAANARVVDPVRHVEVAL
jgi:hypothetical protein